jgi:TfoX/Sxy family transcriptional regulator of competence genes
MAYDENLANRIREQFADLPNVTKKEMMGGLTFMYNNKMCVGIIKDELMCRLDPAIYESVLEKRGCRTMDFTGRPMKGYVMIDSIALTNKKDFDYWISLALEFNKRAKSSKKKQ